MQIIRERAEALAKKIAREIERWNDHAELYVHYDNDGDDHFDFSGFEVQEEGLNKLIDLLEKEE